MIQEERSTERKTWNATYFWMFIQHRFDKPNQLFAGFSPLLVDEGDYYRPSWSRSTGTCREEAKKSACYLRLLEESCSSRPYLPNIL